MGDLRKLQEAAAAATSDGDWLRASSLYASLEKADPAEGSWPLRLGECQRKLGRPGEAVKALTRALKTYGLANMNQKAAAVCRLILELEPQNRQIPPILAALSHPAERPAEPEASAVPKARAWHDSSVFSVPAAMRRAERAQRHEIEGTPTRAPEGVAAASQPAAPTAAMVTPSPAPPRPPLRVLLPRTPFFSAMSERQVRTINERARLLEVETGQILFAVGDPADALYLVAAGRIAVLAPSEVMRLARGDFFGEEVVVLPGQARLATLRAVEPSHVLALDRPLVEELVAETPALLEMMAQALRDRLLDLFIQSSPMLASLPVPARGALMSMFEVFTAEEGDCILDPETSALCALLAGSVDLSLDRRPIDTLHPGDVFGETAWVSSAPAATTAVARERCFVLCLGAADLAKLRSGYPDVIAYLAALAENRLERLRQAIAPPAAPTGSPISPPRVLLAHHAGSTLQSYADALGAGEFLVDSTSDPEVALRIIAEQPFDVVVCGAEWLAEAGSALLGDIRRRDLDVPIILTTRDPQLDTTGAAASHGVVRTFVEPVLADELVDAAARAVRFHRLARMQREARVCLGSSGEWMGDRAGLELHFGNALDHLWMAFQPIVSATARDVFAFEALLRSSEEILSSPVAVLRAAERLRRVHDVGRIARDSVAATAAQAEHPPLLFVNVHHQDLLDQNLLDPQARLSSIASGVVLEVTERKPLDELTDLRARVAALRALGYRFAIDNLGSGHAGIATLAQLEPDIAKLDISLIRNVDHDPVKQGLVASMLQVCHDMGIQAICEGVETVAERDWLLHAGADLMQGYFFAKPGPPFPAVDLVTLPWPKAAGR